MTDAELKLMERLDAQNQLRIARAQAIQSYAGLETSLCSLFAHFLDTTPDVAATVFYRTTNSRSRNTILTKLLKKRHGDSYNPFWNSIVKIIRSNLDETRNQIVHWHEATHVYSGEAGVKIITPHLTPPNYWDRSSDTPTLESKDLLAFVEECDFVSRSLNMFLLLITGTLREHGGEQPWLDICQQEVVYPPPDSHPLSQSERES